MRVWDEGAERAKLARQEEGKTARAQWYRERTAIVRTRVSAFDVLRHFAVPLKQSGAEREEQISCPFHGKDTKPSARVYPSDARSSSHVWCWTCHKRWNVFDLWKEFSGDPEMKFGRVLGEIERTFGITPPDAPSWEAEEAGPSEAERDAFEILEVCERRLREGRDRFDLRGLLLVGQLLDRARHWLDHRSMPPEEVLPKLRQVLDKIGEKIRA